RKLPGRAASWTRRARPAVVSTAQRRDASANAANPTKSTGAADGVGDVDALDSAEPAEAALPAGSAGAHVHLPGVVENTFLLFGAIAVVIEVHRDRRSGNRARLPGRIVLGRRHRFRQRALVPAIDVSTRWCFRRPASRLASAARVRRRRFVTLLSAGCRGCGKRVLVTIH